MSPLAKLTPETHKQFCADVEYLDSHWEELRAAHPNCYIIVYQGQVVGTGPNLRKLAKALDKQGIPTNTIAVRFAADPPRKLIL